jgi:Bacterial capsule synthesis protein PGA_cap
MKFVKPIVVISYLVLAYLVTGLNSSFYLPIKDYGEISSREVRTEETELVRTENIRNDPQSIIFVGDVLLARHVETLMERNGFDYPFLGIDLSQLSSSTYVVGNFEASIPLQHKKTPINNVNFSVADKFIATLIKGGFTHVSLANNHSFDSGQAGFANTAKVLADYRMSVFGSPNTIGANSLAYLSVNGIKVSLIGINAVFKSYSDDEIKTLFELATTNSQFQIVYIHWGDEYLNTSNNAQKDLAAKLIDLGADLIIGHHPHVVQEIGLINNVPVFYSLGNYIFDQYFSVPVQTGLMLNLSFTEVGVSVKLLPTTSIASLSQPRLMSDVESELFLKELAKNSTPNIRPQVENGVLDLNF